MSKNIVGCLRSLDALSEFFKEQEEEKKEFSEDIEKIPCSKAERHHFIHTEDDSVTQEMRGY